LATYVKNADSNVGTQINADTNGTYNILKKVDSNFSFSNLALKVRTQTNRRLHLVKRIHFEKKKTHQQPYAQARK